MSQQMPSTVLSGVLRPATNRTELGIGLPSLDSHTLPLCGWRGLVQGALLALPSPRKERGLGIPRPTPRPPGLPSVKCDPVQYLLGPGTCRTPCCVGLHRRGSLTSAEP